jgi:hypothetical protein
MHMSPLPQLLMMTQGAEAALLIIAGAMKPACARVGAEVTMEGVDHSVSLRQLTRDRCEEPAVHLTAVTLDPSTIFRAFDTQAGNHTINAPLLAGSMHLGERYEHFHERQICFETTWFDRP